jgi:hypothetical protein
MGMIVLVSELVFLMCANEHQVNPLAEISERTAERAGTVKVLAGHAADRTRWGGPGVRGNVVKQRRMRDMWNVFRKWACRKGLQSFV